MGSARKGGGPYINIEFAIFAKCLSWPRRSWSRLGSQGWDRNGTRTSRHGAVGYPAVVPNSQQKAQLFCANHLRFRRSPRSLPTLKNGSLFDLTVIFSPVFGLRPV